MKPLRPTNPRDSYIYIGCTEKFDHVGQTDDSFQLPDDGKTCYIFHQREYPREQKSKVIYALFPFFGARSLKKDPLDELRKYDWIFAIDTNYRDRAITTAVVAAWSSRVDLTREAPYGWDVRRSVGDRALLVRVVRKRS